MKLVPSSALFSPLLAGAGIWAMLHGARAEELVKITGFALRGEAGRTVLEINHQGALTPAKFEKVNEYWRLILPGAVIATPTPAERLSNALARLTPVTGGVALEIKSPTVPVILAQVGGQLRYDLGRTAPVSLDPVPVPLTAEDLRQEGQPRQLIAKRLDLDPVSFDSSLLLSDQSKVDIGVLAARKDEALYYDASPLELMEFRTQGLESGALLKQGEFLQTQIFRVFKPSGQDDDDVFQNTSNLYTYGVSDSFEISADLQGQDNNSPGTAGDYLIERFAPDSGNTSNGFQEYTFQGKFRLTDTEEFKSSLVVSATVGTRAFRITSLKDQIYAFEQSYGMSPTPVIEFPMTWLQGESGAFTINPKVAFFPEDNAGFVVVNPKVGGSFGTTVGLGLGTTQRVTDRIQFRGDLTAILSGNNAVSPTTGIPVATTVYNAGVRYLVNPRLGLDLFASNAYGNTGTGAMTGRIGDFGVGAALTLIPDRFYIANLTANQKFDKTFDLKASEAQRKNFVPSHFGFLDGGTVPEGQSYVQLRTTSNGVLASIRTGNFDDLETGVYANFTASSIDESEAGTSTKIRFLNQAAGDPVTFSGVFTLGRTSARLLNLQRSSRTAIDRAEDPFQAGIGDRGPIAPNLLGLFTERSGETLILSLSAPIEQVQPGYSWWINPKYTYVQRAPEISLVGISLGGSVKLGEDLTIMAEVTPLLDGKNVLIGETSTTRLPWSLGLRLGTEGIFNWVPSFAKATSMDLYVTNTLGASPYQSMRVNVDNALTVGLGFNFPVRLPF